MWFALFVLVLAIITSWNLFDHIFFVEEELPEEDQQNIKEALAKVTWQDLFFCLFLDEAYKVIEIFFLPLCAGNALVSGYGPKWLCYLIFLIWFVNLLMWFDVFKIRTTEKSLQVSENY